MQQSRDGEFAGAGAAADGVGGLEDLDVDAVPGEVDRGSEPVGPAADHDCGGHGRTTRSVSCILASRVRTFEPSPSSVHCTSNGMGPFGSHGCSLIASDTL